MGTNGSGIHGRLASIAVIVWLVALAVPAVPAAMGNAPIGPAQDPTETPTLTAEPTVPTPAPPSPTPSPSPTPAPPADSADTRSAVADSQSVAYPNADTHAAPGPADADRHAGPGDADADRVRDERTDALAHRHPTPTIPSPVPTSTPTPTVPLPVPTSTPTPTAPPTPAPTAVMPPTPTPTVGVGAFAGSLPRPGQAASDTQGLSLSVGLALLILLLAALGAALLNGAMVRRRRARALPPPGLETAGAPIYGERSGLTGPAGVVVFLALAGVAYGYLSRSLESVVMVAGIVIGMVAVTLLLELPRLLVQRRYNGDGGSLRALPLTLVVAVICVLVSRALSFEPGYLYAPIAVYAFRGTLWPRQEGVAALASALLVLDLALVAWLALPMADTQLTGLPLVALLLTTVLSTLVVGGLTSLLVQLVPLRTLGGRRLWAWSRIAWAVMFAVTAFAFVQLLLVPAGGATSTSGPLWATVGALAIFAALSAALWAYVRVRRWQAPIPT
jgi:hypothetical protein